MLTKRIACLMLLGLLPALGATAQDEGQEALQEMVEEAAPSEDAEYVEEEQYVEEEEYYEEEVVEEPPQPVRVQPSVRPPRPPVQPSRPQPIRSPISRSPISGNGETGAGVTFTSPDTAAETPKSYISLDFNEAPLYEVVKDIGRLTGRNFDVDPNISGSTVTLVTHKPIPPELAYQLLEAILKVRGFSMVETVDGHMIQIMATPDVVESEKVPLKVGAIDLGSRYDTYETHVVPVRFGSVEEIAQALQFVASPSATLDAYVPTNTLVITDTVDGLRRIFTLLNMIDVPGSETSMEIFALEYTRAETLATQIEQVLLEDGAPAPGGQPGAPQIRPPTRPSRTVRPNVPGVATSEVIGSSKEVLRMVPDERLNALIVVATAGMMEQVRDLVRRLDTVTPREMDNLHIYHLLHADAEMVEQALQPLLSNAPRQAEGGGAPPALSGETPTFDQQVQLTRYDQTNSLLIVASPQDYQRLESYIALLDVPQNQVMVEAVVMEVLVNNDFGLQVDAAGITGNDGFVETSTGNLQQLAAVAATAGSIAGDPSAPLAGAAGFANAILGLGSEGGITAGVYEDITLDIGGQEVTLPFVPLLFQAIEQLTDVEVLSQPNLMTVDNEEASIVVGQEVPFITQRRTSGGSIDDSSVLNSSFGYTNIQREEVGVKLKMTPQISAGDSVLLEVELEVSSVSATQVGTVDILGPTTDKSLIQSKILVEDGATAVIAGLTRDEANRNRSQTPVLGDLPLLGWLFRNSTSGHSKRNMVVLITPHVIKEGVDLKRVTQYELEDYHDTHLDLLFDEGFFTKVKRKHEMRREHRPTLDRSRGLVGERVPSGRYSRGDIER